MEATASPTCWRARSWKTFSSWMAVCLAWVKRLISMRQLFWAYSWGEGTGRW